VSFGPDSELFATAGNDGSVRLWALQRDGSARETAMLSGQSGGVLSVAFSPDGWQLASANSDGQILIHEFDRIHGRPTLRHRLIGGGLDVLENDYNGHDCWRLRRTDGQPFGYQLDSKGQRLLADPVAYPWLWFSAVTESGLVHCRPVIDVPPEWVEWSEDARTIWVRRAPRRVPA
jgi:WD40 repeat protein